MLSQRSQPCFEMLLILFITNAALMRGGGGGRRRDKAMIKHLLQLIRKVWYRLNWLWVCKLIHKELTLESSKKLILQAKKDGKDKGKHNTVYVRYFSNFKNPLLARFGFLLGGRGRKYCTLLQHRNLALSIEKIAFLFGIAWGMGLLEF